MHCSVQAREAQLDSLDASGDEAAAILTSLRLYRSNVPTQTESWAPETFAFIVQVRPSSFTAHPVHAHKAVTGIASWYLTVHCRQHHHAC